MTSLVSSHADWSLMGRAGEAPPDLYENRGQFSGMDVSLIPGMFSSLVVSAVQA